MNIEPNRELKLRTAWFLAASYGRHAEHPAMVEYEAKNEFNPAIVAKSAELQTFVVLAREKGDPMKIHMKIRLEPHGGHVIATMFIASTELPDVDPKDLTHANCGALRLRPDEADAFRAQLDSVNELVEIVDERPHPITWKEVLAETAAEAPIPPVLVQSVGLPSARAFMETFGERFARRLIDSGLMK